MSHRRTVRAASSDNHRRRLRKPRLCFGTLEERIAPAVFAGAGPALAIDLNSPNEVATFSTDGTTVTVQLTNGTATTAGTSVTGGGTSTATFLSATYAGPIAITDTPPARQSRSRIALLPTQFSITLNDAASVVTFSGTSSFNQTVTIATTAGRVTSVFSQR